MGPGPEHGSSFEEPAAEHEQHDEGRPTPKPDRMDQMEAELTRLREENSLIRKAIPPREPARSPEPDPEDETDWDTLLFENPKEAFRLHGDKVREQTKKELRTEYQKNQGEDSFWREFYIANDDLREDDDLVKSELNKNLAALADLPVPEAMKKLADLTRTRIMRYTRNAGERRRTRAVTEGANAPMVAPESTDDKEANVLSLGDILRARKERRRKASAA